MGKTKIKIIDKSQPEVEVKKEEKKNRSAKFEHDKVVGAVEQTVEPKINEDPGAKQAHSERTGDASGTLMPNEQVKTSKKTQKPNKQTKFRSKKYQESRGKVESNKRYSLNEAVKLAAETSLTKFPGTVEAHLNTNVGNLRGLISLPYFAGKKLVILAFGSEAEKSGADLAGNEETISEIEKGPSTSLRVNNDKEIKFSDVDLIVVTPAWMPKLAKTAKILGPKGLMPNPKNGTITENLAKTVAELQGGKVEYKTEKDGKVIHLPVGKTNQAPEEVTLNIKTLFNAVGKSKISKITLSSTMGPGVKIDLNSI